MAEEEKDTPSGAAGGNAEDNGKTGGAADAGDAGASGAGDGAAVGPGEGNAAQESPQAAVMAQYVKDLSFENPKAAQTLQHLSQSQAQPRMEVNINVGANRLGEEAYEVELKINVASKIEEDETAFAVELVYAGLFGIRNVAENMLAPFLLVQAPHILFPFARRIIADTVRDGGFSPLMLEPIDFAKLYQQQRNQAEQQPQAAPEQSGAGDLGKIDLGDPKGNA